jgi:predicted metal-dependent hydrolase
VTASIHAIFEQAYREVRPRSETPPFKVEFRSYVGVNNTIRLRDGAFLVRISDQLEGAPLSVLRSLAKILLAKIYRRQVPADALRRYRAYVSSHHIAQRSNLVRQMRGKKHIHSARGDVYDLEEIFEGLNRRFFHGLLGRPQLTWSRSRARNRLGHYDPAHNAIVISRMFDHPHVPRYAVEYIVYHEMLHLKYPVKLRGSRRCVHSPEFMAEEKFFPQWREAQRFLKRW